VLSSFFPLKETLAANVVEELRPLLKKAIELHTTGVSGQALQVKHINTIMLFAFETTPAKSNTQRNELLNQL